MKSSFLHIERLELLELPNDYYYENNNYKIMSSRYVSNMSEELSNVIRSNLKTEIMHNMLIGLSWEPICPKRKKENRPGSTNSETGSEGPLRSD
ncbi:hypothetical protein DBV15_07790 [Temnothorax longispinosus]|uniref:Uncharacterized protein n=1 Tax=Temnothorax longispinosus TaxID=300112 RepID=A0A4S2KTE9_9HYME|nr:hypothetical protein DBV15_07790 [Temnothorax longispinosus]